MVALPACAGEDENEFVPERVSNEQALALIRSCEVTRILTAHSGEVDLTLEDGGRVLVRQPHPTALSKAAWETYQERGCEIAVGME